MRSDGKLSQHRNHGIARGDVHGELPSGLRDARISPNVLRGLELACAGDQGDRYRLWLAGWIRHPDVGSVRSLMQPRLQSVIVDRDLLRQSGEFQKARK